MGSIDGGVNRVMKSAKPRGTSCDALWLNAENNLWSGFPKSGLTHAILSFVPTVNFRLFCD